MAAGVITNFHCQAPTPDYFSLIFQRSPCKEDEERMEDTPEVGEDEERRAVDEEEEEDEESDAEEEEEEECLEGVFSDPAGSALDVTKQLLRFADLISHDVQRYFGRCSDDRDACDIYSDSVSVAAGGRLRYYDDLLKIARAGSPEAPEGSSATPPGDDGASGLGPLAELFALRGPSRGHSQPMIKRHLPLSFWTEPTPRCPADSFSNAAGGDAPSQDVAHADASAHCNAHGLESTQPDFSDLLANWDPNLEFTHTLLIQEKKQGSK